MATWHATSLSVSGLLIIYTCTELLTTPKDSLYTHSVTHSSCETIVSTPLCFLLPSCSYPVCGLYLMFCCFFGFEFFALTVLVCLCLDWTLTVFDLAPVCWFCTSSVWFHCVKKKNWTASIFLNVHLWVWKIGSPTRWMQCIWKTSKACMWPRTATSVIRRGALKKCLSRSANFSQVTLGMLPHLIHHSHALHHQTSSLGFQFSAGAFCSNYSFTSLIKRG